MKLALCCVQCVEHGIGSCKDYISIQHSACDLLTMAIVHFDLALLGSEASWHGVTSNISHNHSHLFTEYICRWQSNLNVFPFDECNVVLEVFKRDDENVLRVQDSLQV